MRIENIETAELTRGGQRPLVTVLLSCFNHEEFLPQALEAIAAQSYESIFLLVTDDASEDKSADVIEDFLRTYSGESLFLKNAHNLGFTATLNRARPHVRGEYLNIISADDWMEPSHIERKVAALQALGPRYGMCYGDAYRANQAGDRLDCTFLDVRFDDLERPSGFVFPQLVRGNFIPAHSVVVRRAVFDAVGDYDESLLAEDYDMFLRIARVSMVACVPEPLVTYRAVEGSLFRTTGLTRKRMDEIAALSKHVGTSRDLDEILEDKIAFLAKSLYRVGRNPELTRKDLRPVLRRSPRLENLAYFVAASLGLAWDDVRRVGLIVGRTPIGKVLRRYVRV